MKRYVVYKRVSTKAQEATGLGLKAQATDIDLYLKTYSETPYEILETLTETKSGMDTDRPLLGEAIRLSKANGAELLVSKLDRLSRKVSFIAALMDDKKLRIRIASMPNADNFQLHIYAALAEQEREFISIRTKAALASAKAKGVKLGGLRDKTARRNIAIQANAMARAEKVSSLIIPLRDQGKTLREIAAALNASKVGTARGGKWQASQVQRVLKRLES